MTSPDFAAVRAEFGLPAQFPAEVLAEAASAAARPPAGERVDALGIDLVTIDPPGSKDLDQAVGIERLGAARGFRVHYAIADLGAVVSPGGLLDAEVHRRGQTVYLPDGALPLHPPVLSEDAASLLPDGPRAAILWRVDLDSDGEVSGVDVRRAVVRSRAQLDYPGVQASVDGAGPPLPDALAALPELGRLRRELAVGRGALELELPEQDVVRADGRWRVQLRQRTGVEAWNAEISLLTGMAAAQIMLETGAGLLRTLPAPEPAGLAALRRAAGDLGVSWPERATPAQVLAGLPVTGAQALALRRATSILLRGAGYAWFGPGAPQPADPGHAGIGAPYAHVTAPLRRLVDRFGSELCLAAAAGREPPSWVLDALPALPSLMGASDSLAGRVDRACVDRTEAAELAGRAGERFEAIVLRADPGEVLLAEPPVLAKCTGPLRAGSVATVRLVEAEPASGRLLFSTE